MEFPFTLLEKLNPKLIENILQLKCCIDATMALNGLTILHSMLQITVLCVFYLVIHFNKLSLKNCTTILSNYLERLTISHIDVYN